MGQILKSKERQTGREAVKAAKKQKYFQKRAKTYEFYIKAVPFIAKIRKDERRIINDLISQHITKNDSVLEVGCGTGYYTAYLAQRCKDLTAIDLCEKMVQVTGRKIKRMNLRNVSLETADINKFNPKKKFDKVFCIGVLDYTKDPLAMMKKCSELSSEKIIVTAPHKSMMTKTMNTYTKIFKAEYKHYTKDELKNALNGAGFNQVDIYETGIKTKLTRGATLIAVARK